MRNQLIFILWTYSTLIMAQPILEHTFTDLISIRSFVPGAGERYVKISSIPANSVGMVTWFGEDFAPLGTTTMQLPPNATQIFSFQYTANHFDTDSGIEIVTNWTDGQTFKRYYQVFDDNGFPLTSIYNQVIRLFELTNNTKKMLVGDSVIALPSKSLDFVFPKGKSPVSVQQLEDFGSHYVQLTNNADLAIFGLNFLPISIYKSNVDTTGWSNWSYQLLGQYQINGDQAVEWVLFSKKNTMTRVQLFSNDQLLKEVTTNSGFTNLIIPNSTNELPFPYLDHVSQDFSKTTVYDFFSESILYETNGFLTYSDISPDDPMLFYKLWQPKSTTNFTVLDQHFMPWASFPKTQDSCFISLASSRVFDNDFTQKEVGISYISPNTTLRKFNLVREDGTILLNTDSTLSGGNLSQIQGLKSKLYINRRIEPNMFICDVYALPDLPDVGTHALRPTLKFSVSPNPFSDHIQIDLREISAKTATLTIFSQAGMVIIDAYKLNTDTVNEVNLMPLPTGVYWVRVDCNGQFGWQKVLKME